MPSNNETILYLSRGGDVSGAQRQLYYLLKGLDRGRFTPLVLCTENGPFLEELEAIGVRCFVRKLAGWRKVKHVLTRYGDAAYVADIARKESVALVHSSDIWLSEYMLRAAKVAGIPSILHVRAPIDQRTLDNYRCAMATALVVISKRVEVRLAALSGVPREKIVLIHDAVDPELFRPRDEAANRDVLRQQYLADGKVLVGIVGRVEKEKEQLSFVRIARRVLSRTKEAVFFIIGEMKDHAYCARISRYLEDHGLQDRVHFTGRRDDIGDVLADLDVLVSLSGGSIRYEAMMCGVPVVCAWSRSAEESYHIRNRQTGFLISERQEEPVADALIEMIGDHDLRKRIGHSARTWAQRHLGHSALVAGTHSLYDRLLTDTERATRFPPAESQVVRDGSQAR